MPARKPMFALIALVTALLAAGAAYGQSLADLARQSRAKKSQEAKTGKVFTNDNLPAPTLAAPATAPADAPTPGETGEATAAKDEPPAAAAAPSQADLEKEYRDKFAKLKEDQTLEERKLDVMQRELNLMQQQYYSDPNVALREQNTRAEINTRTADLETQKAAVEKAKQAIADLEEELRQKGLPPGWSG